MGKVKANAAFPTPERSRMAAWKGQVPPNIFLKGDQVLFPLFSCISATGAHGMLLTFLLLTQTAPRRGQHKTRWEQPREVLRKGSSALVFLIINLSFRFEKIEKKRPFRPFLEGSLLKCSVWEIQEGRNENELGRAWKIVCSQNSTSALQQGIKHMEPHRNLRSLLMKSLGKV